MLGIAFLWTSTTMLKHTLQNEVPIITMRIMMLMMIILIIMKKKKIPKVLQIPRLVCQNIRYILCTPFLHYIMKKDQQCWAGVNPWPLIMLIQT